MIAPQPRNPFGEESCEAEINSLQSNYSDYFFTHTSFCSEALQTHRYLFIGRKGAGKTSLAHYFTFHKDINSYECIDVDEPKLYHNVLLEMSKRMKQGGVDVSLTRIATIWEYVIWSLIFSQYADCHADIKAAAISGRDSKWANVIKSLIGGLLSKFAGDNNGNLMNNLEDLVQEQVFQKARDAVLLQTRTKAVIVAIDSLEDYATDDEAMMLALAGLVECASRISRTYSAQGVHLKVFVTAEVFPHLCEEYISNLLKYVRNPLYLHWGPKELIRLICWRLHSYLESTKSLLPESRNGVNWDSPRDVIQKMWNPYFGEWVSNGRGVKERSLPYILRHTQLRPRQLIVLCNAIANEAMTKGTFPKFSSDTIVSGVLREEVNLAKEVLNSYKRIYPNVSSIVSALTSMPVAFEGKMLDGVAKSTSSQWSDGKYNLLAFRTLVAELGIVGRVREVTRNGTIMADFEYSMEDRLFLQPKDECVIHPMFFNKFNIKITKQAPILPFPDKEDFEGLIE